MVECQLALLHRKSEDAGDMTIPMNTFERAEQLVGQGYTFIFGRSVVPGNPRFVTIKSKTGETSASGKGHTCEQALLDAMNRMPVARKMPGMK